jgi:mannitol-1-/sugar-/sorbitol-6-phosphatase
VIDCGALLFDLDGTLVDSSTVMERTWSTWAIMHGFNPKVVTALAHGRRAIDTVRDFLPNGNHYSEVTRLEAIELSELNDVFALPGAADALKMVMDGQWAVVTSGSRKLAMGRLEASGLPLPKVLIAGDDVGRGKPDPEGYIAAAIRLGRNPADCIAFEDAPSGLAAASAAGCTVVALTTTHAVGRLQGAKPHGIIPNLAWIRLGRKDGRVQLTLRHAT